MSSTYKNGIRWCTILKSYDDYIEDVYILPDDKPYRQLLWSDQGYHKLKIELETGVQFRETVIDNINEFKKHKIEDSQLKIQVKQLNTKFHESKWVDLMKDYMNNYTTIINGGKIYLFSKNYDDILKAKYMLDKFVQNVKVVKLKDYNHCYIIIGNKGSNRLTIKNITNYTTFINFMEQNYCYIIYDKYNEVDNDEIYLKYFNDVIDNLYKPILIETINNDNIQCFGLLEQKIYEWNRMYDVLILYKKNYHKNLNYFQRIPKYLEIYGFHNNKQNCINGIQIFKDNIHLINFDEIFINYPKDIRKGFYNLIIGEKCCNIPYLTGKFNISLCTLVKNESILLMHSDDSNGYSIFIKSLTNIIENEIKCLSNISQMHFYRLYTKLNENVKKNISMEYNNNNNKLYYYSMNNNYKAKTEFINFVNYYCYTEHFMTMCINRKVIQILKENKFEILNRLKRFWINYCIRMHQIGSEYLESHNQDPYISIMDIKNTNKIWIFGNHLKIIVKFKFFLFKIIKYMEIIIIKDIICNHFNIKFDDEISILLKSNKLFGIEKGFIKSPPNANVFIYSKGFDRLYIFPIQINHINKAKEYLIKQIIDWYYTNHFKPQKIINHQNITQSQSLSKLH